MASPQPSHVAAAPVGAQTRAEAIKARVFLVVLCIGWGVTWPMMSIALSEIPPFSMRVTGLVLGAITLTSLARLQGISLRLPSWWTFAHLCAASLFNIVAFSIFTPFAQLHAETSRVAIVVYTMPIWATLLALPILRERLTATRALALVLCIAGMAVLSIRSPGSGYPSESCSPSAPRRAGPPAPCISNGRGSIAIRWRSRSGRSPSASWCSAHCCRHSKDRCSSRRRTSGRSWR